MHKAVTRVMIAISIAAGLALIGFIIAYFIMVPYSMSPNYPEAEVLVIDSDEDFVELNFPGSGTKDDPFIIEGYELGLNEHGVKNYVPCISIKDTTRYFIVQNCQLFGGSHSMKITNILEGSGVIKDNYIYQRMQSQTDVFNVGEGITVFDSDGVIFQNNTFEAEDDSANYCIYLNNSNNAIIKQNLCKGYVSGIQVEHSENTTISSNTIKYGEINLEKSFQCYIDSNILEEAWRIRIAESEFIFVKNNSIHSSNFNSILIYDTSQIIIQNNTLEGGINGILIIQSSFNLIISNLITGCGSYGVNIMENSFNNTIFHNSFIGNNNDPNQKQALDDGFFNDWFNFVINEGNFWSDLGLNSTYEIDGTAGSFDLYPLSSPP